MANICFASFFLTSTIVPIQRRKKLSNFAQLKFQLTPSQEPFTLKAKALKSHSNQILTGSATVIHNVADVCLASVLPSP